MRINNLLDFSLVKPTATKQEIISLCSTAVEYGFRSVCVPPPFVKLCKEMLNRTPVKISTVIGYPYGYSAVEAKLAEILLSIVDGVDDLEVVINYMAIKNSDWKYISNELIHLMQVAGGSGKGLTIVTESVHLSTDELIKCCELYGAADIQALKSSTGVFPDYSLIEKIGIMRKHLPKAVNVIAYGDINDYSTAVQLLNAGATFIGSEKADKIINEYLQLTKLN